MGQVVDAARKTPLEMFKGKTTSPLLQIRGRGCGETGEGVAESSVTLPPNYLAPQPPLLIRPLGNEASE